MGLITLKEINKYTEDNKFNGFQYLDNELMSSIDRALLSFQEKKEELEKAGNKAALDTYLKENKDYAMLNAYIRRDYTRLNSMPKLFQNYCLTSLRNEMFEDFDGTSFTITNSNFREYIKANSLNPLLQTNLEMIKGELMDNPNYAEEIKASINSEAVPAGAIPVNPSSCTEAVSFVNEYIMEGTLAAVDFSIVEENKEYSINDYNANISKQTVLATGMLLAHLGDLYINPDPKKAAQEIDANTKDCKAPISELFVHGGRTLFMTPKGNKGIEFLDTATMRNDTSVVEGRRVWYSFGMNFASHEIEIGKDKNNNTTMKETKATTVAHNTGMNLSIGGMGKTYGEGSSWFIKNSGRDGHMYMKVMESKNDTPGYIMLGIEGEAPGQKGRLGNKHDSSAKKAPISSFGATKHAIGRTYDGRRVDLTKYSQDDLTDLIRQFQDRYSSLLKTAGAKTNTSKEAEEKNRALIYISKINKRLSGVHMDKEELIDFLRSDAIDINNHSIYKDIMPEYKTSNTFNNLQSDDLDNALIGKIVNANIGNSVVNPKIHFFKDRFEIVSKELKKDPEAKKLVKLLDKVTDADVHADEEKYKKDLAELIKKTSTYVNSSKDKAEGLKAVTVALLKECGAQYQKINGVDDLTNAPAVQETLQNGDWVKVDSVDMTYDTISDNNKRREFEDYIKSVRAITGDSENKLTKAAKSTWRDSDQYKKLQASINKFNIIAGKDIKKNLDNPSIEFSKALIDVYTKANAYVDYKKGPISDKSQVKVNYANELMDKLTPYLERAADVIGISADSIIRKSDTKESKAELTETSKNEEKILTNVKNLSEQEFGTEKMTKPSANNEINKGNTLSQ